MEPQDYLFFENVKNQAGALLVGINNTNAIDRLALLQKIKNNIEKIEQTIKNIIDRETEKIACAKIGKIKHYPNTMIEKI